MTNSPTPCRKICTFDQEIGLCTGCWRNLDEIARWASLSDAERSTITASLRHRERTFTDKVMTGLTAGIPD